MKFSSLKYLIFIAFLFGCLYFVSKLKVTYEDQHTSLNDHNLDTDLYLSNVNHYIKEDVFERSIYHLEKAQESLKSFEEDIDINSGEDIEESIEKLEKIKSEILMDSLVSTDMSEAFSTTLQSLSLAELRISEKYAESNKLDISLIALKYARLHLKNAIAYTRLPERKYEINVYLEMDSLIESHEISPVEVAEKIDHMISEIDVLIHHKNLAESKE